MLSPTYIYTSLLCSGYVVFDHSSSSSANLSCPFTRILTTSLSGGRIQGPAQPQQKQFQLWSKARSTMAIFDYGPPPSQRNLTGRNTTPSHEFTSAACVTLVGCMATRPVLPKRVETRARNPAYDDV
jgi:hypothetical protein